MCMHPVQVMVLVCTFTCTSSVYSGTLHSFQAQDVQKQGESSVDVKKAVALRKDKESQQDEVTEETNRFTL